jgi:hypothetical protein
MGIDYSGGMIVGELGSVLPEQDGFEDLMEWAEGNEMVSMALYYDADLEDRYYGFAVENVLVSEIDQKWIDDLKKKADQFEKLSGVPAKLVGTQNIW